MSNVQEKMKQIVNELKQSHFEREEAIEACVLGLLTANHVALIGAPGTAKSLLCRDLTKRLTGLTYFETILSRTRPAEAVLGPLDLPKLRDTGSFVRKTKGYLPEADVAFIDEGFKISPTLGHDLLGILNERVFHQVDENGRSVHNVPLKSAFIASNETPTDDEENAALWDRITLRWRVEYTKTGASFNSLFDQTVATGNTEIAWSDMLNVIENEIPLIPIPAKVIDTLRDVRGALAEALSIGEAGIVLSDRRWKACGNILRANAWLNGRDMVVERDLLVLKYVLWNELQDIQPVERILIRFADKVSDQIRTLRDNIGELAEQINNVKGHSKEQRSDHGTHTLRKVKAVKQELLRLDTDNPNHEEIKVTLMQLEKVWVDMFKVLLDTDQPASFSKWYNHKD